jgi:hypothetical protein
VSERGRAPFLREKSSKDFRAGVRYIPRGGQEGDWSRAGELEQPLDRVRRRRLAKLCAVSARELVESIGVVVVPTPQLGARSDFLEPLVECGRRLRDSSGPQPVYEDARAINVLALRFVDAAEPNLCWWRLDRGSGRATTACHG